jgi:hypothetical protein
VNFPGFWPRIRITLGDSWELEELIYGTTLSMSGIRTSCSVMENGLAVVGNVL